MQQEEISNIFSSNDLEQMYAKGITLGDVNAQIDVFERGFKPVVLDRPARVDDGVVKLAANQLDHYIGKYSEASPDVLKFVPASGAASRMFRDLHEFVANGEAAETVNAFFDDLHAFAFYDDLKASLTNSGIEPANAGRKEIIEHLLTVQGLDYSSLPKALIKFHRYGTSARTSIEEHLVEAANYGRSKSGIARIHFTVSPEHMGKIRAKVDSVKTHYQEAFDIQFEISFSIQSSSTDTIAVELNNQPFRDDSDRLVFRPAGHGALLENLNDMKADIIFIKNIDNVLPDTLKADTYSYKKALAGYLLEQREKVFGYLELLKNNEIPGDLHDQVEAAGWQGKNSAETCRLLFNRYNRPMRVCGMVKNEGEPGGGPFWVRQANGETTLQIVEKSQVNSGSPEQMAILANATHFNPVDLVCSTVNYQGKPFDLFNYRDDDTGFITQKSQNGKPLKALELPGLWNGAMAHWLTWFVEVPLSTFNPVKTVNDLLKPEHR